MAKRLRKAAGSSGVDMMDRRYIAEFAGTLILVLMGCGSIAIGGFSGNSPAGILGIGLTFGLTVTAMAYSVATVSGAHLNPAVTTGMWMAGRIRDGDVAGYIVAQCLGAIVGIGIVVLVLYAKAGAGFSLSGVNLGQNAFAAGNQAMITAALVEFIATLIFVLVILGATSGRGATPFPGLIIGLTLAILHLPFFAVTGLSVNPARSLGPALWAGLGGNVTALTQLGLFIVAPLVGGLVAGWLARERVFD